MLSAPASGARTCHVRLADGPSWTVTDGSILDGALAAGIVLPHDCREGGCGSCRVRVLAGRVTYEDDAFPMGLTEEEAAQGYALACQARPEGDLVLEAPRPAAAPEACRRVAVVREIELVAPGIARLAMSVPGLGPSGFVAGQYLNVLLPDGAVRSFSMASCPDGDHLDIFLRRYPGGRFTGPTLDALRPGDTLEVELPLGSFIYRLEDDLPVLLVGTGTGVAPLKAIAETLLGGAFPPPVALYWGMRTEAELFAGEDLAALTGLRFVPVLSQPGVGWVGQRGHVQDAVLRDVADLSGHAIYLCGSPAMIAACKHAFLAAGAPAAHLYAEGFVAGPTEPFAAPETANPG